MLKKLGLAGVLGLGMLVLGNPQKADARIRVGVSIGTPVYRTYPVDPYYYNQYYDPYYGYPSYYSYPYAAPAYVSPYVYNFRFGRNGDSVRHELRERERHERHELRENFRRR